MLDLLSQKIVQESFIINSIICTCVEIIVEISGVFFSIRCRYGAGYLCFVLVKKWTNVTSKGRLYICVILFGVSFFSDVHARQRVALHALLKYYIVVFRVLSNQLLLRVV